jgi:hypothetical protein
MGKLWVFGCSLSTGFKGAIMPYDEKDTWAGKLADKLNLELVNQAHAGQCNWVSILQKGDIVVFEFTFFDRFNVYPTRAQFADLEGFFIKHKSSLTEVNKELLDINFKWFGKQVHQWCTDNQIPIYLWSVEGQLHSDFKRYMELYEFIAAPNYTLESPNFSFYYKWQDLHPEQWCLPDDRHFGELGHERMANHLYDCIKNNIQYTYRK